MNDSSSSDNGDLREALEGFVEDVGAGAAAAAAFAIGAGGRRRHSLVGERLGDYVLTREIGRGGMGVIYEAEQGSVPGRRVAVKTLDGSGGVGELRLQRFAREIEVIGRLDHPNIVPILSAHLDTAVPHYAMKLLRGVSLREWLVSEHWDPLAFGAIARMFHDLALALEHAHRNGVVHRDVTPRNVLIEAEHRPVLVDFGLAHDEHAALTLTISSDAIGTADYMAPEQVTSGHGPITACTDVYGLGATLYHCLTGRPPYRGASRHETFERIIRGDAPAVRRLDRAVPRDLETVCMTAMARTPSDRYPSAGAMAADLDAFLRYLPIVARPPGPLRRLAKWLRRHAAVAVGVALMLVGVLVTVLYFEVWRPRARVGDLLADVARAETERAACVARADALSAAAGVADAEARRALAGLSHEIAAADDRIAATLDQCARISPDDPRVRRRSADFAARKLHAALDELAAFFRPAEVERWERMLTANDIDGEHADLLERKGILDIDCASGPAICSLHPVRRVDACSRYASTPAEGATVLGETPIPGAEIREGSYMLVFRRDGCVDTRLPLLVRRKAVQRIGPGPNERRVRVHVHDAETIGKGFRYIPGGFTVVGDRRTGWVWVDDFFIAEWELTAGTLARLEGTSSADAQERAVLSGLDQDRIREILRSLNRRQRNGGAARVEYRLPTREQWERAARGADGRRYPWGDEFDQRFCRNGWTVDHPETLVYRDVSPFGVRDMAGSVQEPVWPSSDRELESLGWEHLMVRGGAYLSRRAEELSLSWEDSQLKIEARRSTGLRLIKMPLAEPELAVPTGDRQAVSLAAGDWHAFVPEAPVDADDRLANDAGALVVEGYRGNFTSPVLAWTPVSLDASAFRVEVEIEFTVDPELASVRPGTVSLVLGDRPSRSIEERHLELCWSSSDNVVLLDGDRDRQVGLAYRTGRHRLELSVSGGRAQAWIHAADRTRPAQPTVALALDAAARREIRYLGIKVRQFAGVRARVSRLTVMRPD